MALMERQSISSNMQYLVGECNAYTCTVLNSYLTLNPMFIRVELGASLLSTAKSITESILVMKRNKNNLFYSEIYRAGQLIPFSRTTTTNSSVFFLVTWAYGAYEPMDGRMDNTSNAQWAALPLKIGRWVSSSTNCGRHFHTTRKT